MAKVIDITLKLIDKCSSPLKGVQKGQEQESRFTEQGETLKEWGLP